MATRIFPSTAELEAALGAFIADAADAAIAEHGTFHVATSGGSLPKVLAQALRAAMKSGRDLRMSAWHIHYADERRVPLDDAESNHAATVAALAALEAHPRAGGAPAYETIDPALEVAECAAAYEARILTALRCGASLRGAAGAASPSFDLVLLGMGPDGHTASLFPGHPLLEERERLVAPIADSPKPPPHRVTLTLPMINAAARVAVVATGAGKAPAIARALDAAVPAAEVLPVGRVRQAGGAPATWFLDTPAAGGLPGAE